jgi:hypothetical protein
MPELEGGSPQGSPTSSEGSAGVASPAPISTPQSNPSSITPTSPKVTKGAESAPAVPGAIPNVAPAWTPNWKFKAAGKEHEIPEFLRSVVKDADTEKQLKELHEKAYGLDLVKNNYQATQAQLQQLQKTVLPEYKNLKKTVDSVVMYRNNGDLDSVFESIGIPPNVVAQWMYKRLQLQELSPEQRSVYENEQILRKQNYALQEKVQNLSQGHEQTQLQTRAMELQSALAKPEVVTVAESYNTRMGQPDAFWNFVCQQADFMERNSGQRVNAEQAIQQSLKILGTSIVPGPAQGGAPAGNVTPAQAQGNPNPPVIPNITGARNTSPTKKLARSVDDLRKLAKEMSGNTA